MNLGREAWEDGGTEGRRAMTIERWLGIDFSGDLAMWGGSLASATSSGSARASAGSARWDQETGLP
jgi:hypothetical protein